MSHDMENCDSNKPSNDTLCLKKEIALLKQELKTINNKLDLVLDMLNNFTLMLLEEGSEDDEDDIYNTEWVPEQEEEWDTEEDDEEDA